MKRKGIFGLIIIGTLLFGLYWLATHALIEVHLENAGAGAASYKFLDQSGQQSTEITSAAPTVKKVVRRGSHEVLVQRGETSYFAVVETGGFLGKTTIDARLAEEKNRTFVGNNPSSCAYLTGGRLLSLPCGDSVGQLQTHVPATADNPTYVESIANPVSGFVEGIVDTAQGSTIFLKPPEGAESTVIPHLAFILDGGGSLTSQITLPDLTSNQPYSVIPHKKGFLAYSIEGGQAFIYSSLNERPTVVSLVKPEAEGLFLDSLQTQGESLGTVYSNDPTAGTKAHFGGDQGLGEHSEELESGSGSEKLVSEVVIQNGTSARHFTFEAPPEQIRYCADVRLCVVNDGLLTIYDISGEAQKPLFSINAVLGIESIPGKLLVTRQEGVLALDIQTREAVIEYSLGGYTSCGLKPEAAGYLVCVVNEKEERMALYINQAQPNQDSIDKKVAELEKLPEVKDVSAYGRFIYVSPEAGELVLDESLGGFGYDPVAVRAASQAITQMINRLGIDRSAYTVINTLE